MSGTYRANRAFESHVTAMELEDGRRFLVIQFRIQGWQTLVLEHGMRLDSWLSRREICGYMEAVPALSGLLLGPQQLPHPIEELKKRLALEQRQNCSLKSEIRRLTLRAEKAGRKRGGRGRRNS